MPCMVGHLASYGNSSTYWQAEMINFPVRARPDVGMRSDQSLWKKSFSIETDLEIVQPPGSYNSGFTAGRLAAGEDAPGTVEIISPTAAPRKLHPPACFPRFSGLLLPVLDIPEVDCTVRTYVPEGTAVTRALVDVKLPLGIGVRGSSASTLRKLFAETSSARCRRRQVERVRPKEGPVELPPEVVRVVFGKLSCKEMLGAAKAVNRTWRDAADAVFPPGSFRRRLYELIHREPGRYSGSGGEGGGRGASPIDRDLWPRVSWLKENQFYECSGEGAMEILESGLRWLEAKVAQLEEFEFSLAALSGDDDGDEIDVAANVSADALQLQRLRPFLAGVKKFCEERGVSCGAVAGEAAATPVEIVSPPTNVPFGLRLGKTAVAEVAASATAAESSGPPSTTIDDSRWDGWLVFAAAIALAFSEDRPFLCRCALESVWGTSGLPRTQMIELLSRMYFALQPPPRARATSQGTAPMGFQAASGVSTANAWDARGSTRLRSDLMNCVCALESYFVRFPRPQPIADGEDDAVWSQSTAGGYSQTASVNQQQQQQQVVDESMLTAEQREVVNTVLNVGQTLKVVAYAGTGKTATLRAYATRNPHLRTVYLAFNSSVAMEAGLTFPKHVECMTMNSLAMKNPKRRRNNHGLEPDIKTEVALFLRRRDRSTPLSHARLVHSAIERFCCSKDPEPSYDHVYIPPLKDTSGDSSSQRHPQPSAEWVLGCAREVWGLMRTRAQPQTGSNAASGGGGGASSFRFSTTHNSILKLYQLTKPNLSDKFDLILLDEAQDINDCQADIITRQRGCRVIVVGDPNQAIYGWRGAKNYIGRIKNAKTLRLTQVFRFGTGIASVANTLLRRLKGQKVPLLGSLASSTYGPAKVLFEGARDEWLKQTCEDRGRYAFIARTNATLLQEAIAAIGRGDRVAVQNGPGTLRFSDVVDMCHMMDGNLAKVRNKELKEIGSIAELRELIDNVDDNDMQAFASTLDMVDHFVDAGKTTTEVMSEIKEVKRMLQPHTNVGGPLVILSTVHKLKGLEFDTVVLANDFSFEPLDGRPLSFKSKGENTNLIYVAVTRAKRQLFLNRTLARQLRSYRLWDSVALPGLGQDLALDNGTPIPCHDYGCACADPWGLAPANPDGAAPAGGGGGEGGGASQRRGLLFAGSGSTGPLCERCVEGAAEGVEGEANVGSFPYAAQFLKARKKA